MRKIIWGFVQLIFIVLWMLTCFYVCKSKEGFDYLLYWILCGFPFGIGKMCLILIPRNFGIAGGIGVLALNGIIGGIIGGFVLIFKVIKILIDGFWTVCPKVKA